MNRICFISFSNNSDHQNTIYSMFLALNGKADVYTIGIKNPKSIIAPKTDKNYYCNCPKRPGIELKTLNFISLLKIAKFIKKNKIEYLYFESLHVWNLFLMRLCPKCIRIVAVHDVIPHDKNKNVSRFTKMVCKKSDHVILRNAKYKNTLAKLCGIPLSKITCFDLWRFFPKEKPTVNSKVFLLFGRLRKYKGLEQFALIAKKAKEVNFLVVGSPDKESIDVVKNLKNYPNVRVIDREVDDNEMESFFAESDWVILPYSSATQSGVIVDSFKFSRPVIAFDVGAISEQVKNELNGFLVKEGDIDGFVEAIAKAKKMTNDELSEFSHNAYESGYQKYSAESVANSFVKTLLSIEK